MKVFGYRRVSGDGQIDGDGPARQAEKIEKFCAANGLELVRHWDDMGVSGTCEWMNREGFAGMLEAAAAAGVTAIVVERIDRIARDLLVGEFILRELRARGLQLFAADQGLVDVVNADGDPTRTLIRQILSALSQWERSMIVSKLAAARARKKAETGRCEGQKPYGELPGERETLQLIRDGRRRGLSFGAIADYLHYDCAKLTRGGKPWTAKRVARILENKVDTSV